MDSDGVSIGSSQAHLVIPAGTRDRLGSASSETKGSPEIAPALSVSTDSSSKDVQVVPFDTAVDRVNDPLASTEAQGADSDLPRYSSDVSISALASVNPPAQDLDVAVEAQALLVQAQAEWTVQFKEAEAATNTEQESAIATEDDEPSKLSQNRESIEERLEHSREQREAYAARLQELKQRISNIQQQFIDSGSIEFIDFRGNFLDLRV